MTDRAYTVNTGGVGFPDYQTQVFASKARAGLELKYNQRMKLFTYSFHELDTDYPLAGTTPLAPGASQHLNDADTNTAMPFTIEAGYSITLVAYGIGLNQDAHFYGYFDNYRNINFGYLGGGIPFYANRIWDISSLWFDPLAESSHTFDIKVYNDGPANLYGIVTFWALLTAENTPPFPDVQTIKCTNCGNEQSASVKAIMPKCNNCGFPIIVTRFMGYPKNSER